MQRLGGREIPPEVETLEQRLVERLNEALERQMAGEFQTLDEERGLAVFGDIADATTIVLSIEDVARICAQEARDWF